MLSAKNKEDIIILVVDDTVDVAETHAAVIEELGYQSIIQTDPRKVEEQLVNNPDIQLVLSDVEMPHLNGLELLSRIKLRKPQVGVIMATVVNDIEKAVLATKRGAYNYLLKPIKPERLDVVLQSYIENEMSDEDEEDPRLSIFKTRHPIFDEIFRRVKSYAKANVPILIEGETGTGKELIAQLIHALSQDENTPFVPVNVAALSDQLFESELFGHCKGAFTGALTEHKGYFEEAGHGTLFLDEIGELGTEQQKKLLRVMQDKTFTRLGETTSRTLNARCVFATNRQLRDEIDRGRFRDDLYYRVANHVITLPPLRERDDDVELLAKYFFQKYCAQYGRNLEGFTDEAMAVLNTYSFPGNVRELEGIVSGAVLIEQQTKIQIESLPAHLTYSMQIESGLEATKIKEILRALKECSDNQTKAAAKLGVSRGTMVRWVKELKEQGKYSPS